MFSVTSLVRFNASSGEKRDFFFPKSVSCFPDLGIPSPLVPGVKVLLVEQDTTAVQTNDGKQRHFCVLLIYVLWTRDGHKVLHHALAQYTGVAHAPFPYPLASTSSHLPPRARQFIFSFQGRLSSPGRRRGFPAPPPLAAGHSDEVAWRMSRPVHEAGEWRRAGERSGVAAVLLCQ